MENWASQYNGQMANGQIFKPWLILNPYGHMATLYSASRFGGHGFSGNIKNRFFGVQAQA
jgi:hypothetical protein